MPRVQLYQRQVQNEGGTGARFQASNFGPSPFAEGLKKFGSVLSNYAEDRDQIGALQDQASAKEATNAIVGHYAEVGYTGPNAFFEKQGKDALETRPIVEKSVDSLIEQTRAGLRNDRQRQMFDDAINPQRRAWQIQIADHANKETRQYDIDQSTGRAGLSRELGVATYVSDPEHGEQQISTGMSEVANLGRLQGWSSDKVALEQLKFASGAYRDIGTRLAYEGGANGPKLAEALVAQRGLSMTADDREAILTHARVQQNSLEAEQHRQEALSRRADREAKQDARDRAESIYRAIQDGSVVEPARLAGAIQDATKAEDSGLAESLRQGGLKNNLTQQWAGAPPAELQSRIDELSAEITQKGGKVAPDLVVERDHLKTLVTKSRGDLQRDPLSWGAEHLGMNIPPLNLQDQGSINARLEASTTIARRTGTEPRPLTQDEVTATQQTLQHGSTEDKVGLALRLARLGPLALPAAEQLTNNSGFINLIGLATHSNRGVAASRVNQIVTGYDVLKTKPKLVNKDAATQQFNEYVGSSLQFLPQVKDGVLSNAQALLASQANDRGWSDWGEIDGRAWYRAVNSALGAYNRDGKQVGGLARFNGSITVLPEDMSQEDFEARISKAHGPEFRAAQNGQPTFGDGRTPTATDLKRMQWVPSGDGIYRISNGNGFLKTKAGGFYEIDVSKLNSPSGGGARRPFGMIKPGNIDVHHRPIVHNNDGSISTVRSISVGTDQGEVLIPTVVGGKVVSDKDAIAHFKATGEHLGIFKDEKAATAFAKALHQEQDQEYSSISPANLARYGYTRH